MASQQASQRDKVIRDAKYPRSKPITSYQFPKREIQRFLSAGARDFRMFDAGRRSLEEIIRSDEERRDEARRDLKALDAFIEMWRRRRLKDVEMGDARVDLPMTISGVLVNVRLDVSLLERSGNNAHSGGIVLFLAQTPQARKNIEERRRQVAQLILWTLEDRNIEPLPRLCMSVDVFGQTIVKATDSNSRFRGYVRSTCREVCLKWPDVEPPEDYDGPNP